MQAANICLAQKPIHFLPYWLSFAMWRLDFDHSQIKWQKEVPQSKSTSLVNIRHFLCTTEQPPV
jgi:hypothetical protein